MYTVAIILGVHAHTTIVLIGPNVGGAYGQPLMPELQNVWSQRSQLVYR